METVMPAAVATRLALARSELPAPQVDADEAGRTAQSVLNGRKYLEAARPPSWRERAFDWIAERIGDLLNALSSGGGRGLIAWVVVGLFLALVFFLLTRLLGQVDPVRRVRPAPDPEIELFSDRTSAEWLQAAVAAEAAGEWADGLRCRHRALTVELVENGLADARPGQTAAEIDRQASARLPELDGPLTQATRLFEDVWYGWRDADTGARDDFVRHASAVRAAIEGASVDAGRGAS